MPRWVDSMKTYVEPVHDIHGPHVPEEPTAVLHEVVFKSGEEPEEGQIVTAECGAQVRFIRGEFSPGTFQCRACVNDAQAAMRAKMMVEERIFFGRAYVDTRHEVSAVA